MNKEQAFYAAVGKFVISWGDMEYGLDFIAHLIRHLSPVQRSQRVPQQLCRKIDFIKARVDALADANDCTNLLDQIETIAETRHDLIHGAAIIRRFDRNKPAEVIFDRLFSSHRQPDRTMTTEEIIEIEKRVRRLGDRVWDTIDGIIAASQFQPPQSN